MHDAALPDRDVGFRARSESMTAALALAAFAAALAALALSRTYFGFGTETDYVDGFLQEAERALSGAPLTLEWHPPLYALTLALVQSFTHDWFGTGILVSYLSAIPVIVCSFLFLGRVAGAAAGWGAVLGLASSSAFLAYAVSATSDVFFLALFMGSLLFVLLAIETRHPLYWAGSGLVIGLALLTRSNAITLVLLFAAPLLCEATMRQKRGYMGLMLLGLALPLGLWGLHALSSGSPLLPTRNHVNLALTYFVDGPDRISRFARQQVEGRFTGLLDVLLHDPARIAVVYVKDLVNLVRAGLPELIEAPFHLLFLPGLIFLVIRCWNRVLAFFGAVILAQVLLLNMKAFEPRYFMLLVPFFGAGVVEIVTRLMAATADRRGRMAIAALFVLGAVAAVGLALYRAEGMLSRSHAELVGAVPQAREVVDAPALMVARKPHLGFYTDTTFVLFPNVTTLEDLHRALETDAGSEPAYLFFGEQERLALPELASLSRPDEAPGWLRPVAASSKPGAWALYRYVGAD
jgi:hypothetical protein